MEAYKYNSHVRTHLLGKRDRAPIPQHPLVSHRSRASTDTIMLLVLSFASSSAILTSTKRWASSSAEGTSSCSWLTHLQLRLQQRLPRVIHPSILCIIHILGDIHALVLNLLTTFDCASCERFCSWTMTCFCREHGESSSASSHSLSPHFHFKQHPTPVLHTSYPTSAHPPKRSRLFNRAAIALTIEGHPIAKLA